MLKAWLRKKLLESDFDPARELQPPLLAMGAPLLKIFRIENGFLIEHGFTPDSLGIRYTFCKDVPDLQQQIVATFARTRLELRGEQLDLFGTSGALGAPVVR